MPVNEYDRKRYNGRALATYNALFYENRYRNKALITITVGDERIKSLFELRRDFMRILNSLLRRQAFKDQQVAYFTNIELGKTEGALEKKDGYGFNPHLHIQFFYDDFTPIQLALDKLQKSKKWSDLKNLSQDTANDKNAYMGYVVKDYVLRNYSQNYEENKKELAKGRTYHTHSRNWITNYAIRHIFGYLNKHMSAEWKALKKRQALSINT